MSKGNKTMFKLNHKRVIIEIILFIVIVYFHIQKPLQTQSSNTIYETKLQNTSSYDAALVNTFLDAIKDATVAFYADKYTIPPVVSYYSISLQSIKPKDITSPASHILMTFKTKPYLGAHNTIGIDEITFQASYTGETSLIEYKHIQSFDLPKHLQDLLK